MATAAIDADRKERPQAPTVLGMTTEDWVICQILRREAEAVVNAVKR